MNSLPLACLTVAASLAVADERILSYDSDIIVRQNASLLVTETIRVRAEGSQIRRGIYRDFPTGYRDRYGNDYRVRFEPIAVLRNGAVEDYHSERIGTHVRTYFGRANRLIDPGEHNYTFRYEVNRVLGFFEDYDELYWNVTGNRWAFPIDQASARVSFKFDVPQEELRLHAYTGPEGSSGQDYVAVIDAAGSPAFETSRTLRANEGLTISVTWPKGLVSEPAALQRTAWLLADNLNLFILLAGLLAVLSYYVPIWRHYGKDPEPGVIFARYGPPEGFSPASLRYIEKMGYDNTSMTAAVVSLAVKGYLRIVEDDGEHSLLRIDPGNNALPLATGERELHDALFADGDIVILDDEYHRLLGGARAAHENSLRRDYKRRYFKTNGLLNLPAFTIAGITSLIALNVGPGPTLPVMAAIAVMALLLLAFTILMRRPTGLGRRLLDEIGGFREFLEIAEKDEMNLKNPPERTPKLFEEYLPFALAMGVEQQWAEKFTAVFAKIGKTEGGGYHPSWYSGSWNNFDLRSNTAGISGGLGSAISSSVSPPGSSSGSGGGGASGGGGGGGGGGGW